MCLIVRLVDPAVYACYELLTAFLEFGIHITELTLWGAHCFIGQGQPHPDFSPFVVVTGCLYHPRTPLKIKDSLYGRFTPAVSLDMAQGFLEEWDILSGPEISVVIFSFTQFLATPRSSMTWPPCPRHCIWPEGNGGCTWMTCRCLCKPSVPLASVRAGLCWVIWRWFPCHSTPPHFLFVDLCVLLWHLGKVLRW